MTLSPASSPIGPRVTAPQGATPLVTKSVKLDNAALAVTTGSRLLVPWSPGSEAGGVVRDGSNWCWLSRWEERFLSFTARARPHAARRTPAMKLRQEEVREHVLHGPACAALCLAVQNPTSLARSALLPPSPPIVCSSRLDPVKYADVRRGLQQPLPAHGSFGDTVLLAFINLDQ